jgi:hypothetical protein
LEELEILVRFNPDLTGLRHDVFLSMPSTVANQKVSSRSSMIGTKFWVYILLEIYEYVRFAIPVWGPW